MHPEQYGLYMLLVCFPFRNEIEVKFNNSYETKLNFSGAFDTVNFNRCKVEPYATIAVDAYKRLLEENQANTDHFGHQENNETYAELNEEMWNSQDEGNDVKPESQSFSERIDFCNHRVPLTKMLDD